MSAQGPSSAPEHRARLSTRPQNSATRIEKAAKPRATAVRLIDYLRNYWTPVIIVFVLIVIYTVLGLMAPYLMGVAIDKFIGGKDPRGLAWISLLMLGVYLASNLLQIVANWIMSIISQRSIQTLRGDLFDHLQVLPIQYYDAHTAGEMMSRLTNDIDAINQAVSQNVLTLVASVFSIVGILVAMFWLDWRLALVTLIVVPIMFWFAEFVARYTRRGYRRLQKGLGTMNSIAEESISGQKVVKAFQRNDTVLDTFRAQNEEVYHAGVYANSYALLLMPLTNVLGNFFVILLAGAGGWLALAGMASVGIIATFINYGQNFVAPLRQLANMYNSIQAALAGAERIFEVMDVPGEAADPIDAQVLNPAQGSVVFDDVNFAYVPGTPVIRGMDLNVKPGDTVALVGPTGAGKTTLINLLMRFYDPQSGGIAIDGVDIRDLKRDNLRRLLGIVLQDTYLFSNTVMENIRYGRLEASDEECIHAAELADADHFIRQLPNGYHTQLSERGGNLSQGQRQLLAIARAILADPTILILDEATSSVDTRTEARIQRSLLKLMQGRTSFVIAHRLSTIREADNVVVIDHGKIVEQGSHPQLMAKKGFYYGLYMSQFKGQEI